MSPMSLRLAAGLVAVESVFLIVVAVLGLVQPNNLDVAIGMAVLYLVCSLGLALAAVGLWERRSWGRAPVVFAQLVIFGVSWDVHTDAMGVAITGLVLGAAVLACVFHPASTRSLAGDS